MLGFFHSFTSYFDVTTGAPAVLTHPHTSIAMEAIGRLLMTCRVKKTFKIVILHDEKVVYQRVYVD